MSDMLDKELNKLDKKYDLKKEKLYPSDVCKKEF